MSELAINYELDHPGMLYDRATALGATSMLLDKFRDPDFVAKALELENFVWDKSGFNDAGSIDDYQKYLDQSRIFASFTENGDCLGVSRVFEGKPELPPFTELPIENDIIRKEIELGCQNGTVEELATAAIAPNVPGGTVSIFMWRLAYRDAVARGVEKWGIIMEPERVQNMNRRYGFCFEQIGPKVYYQGGECAAHILDLHQVQEHMSAEKPENFDWFVNQELGR